jgi:hypothetical protein
MSVNYDYCTDNFVRHRTIDYQTIDLGKLLDYQLLEYENKILLPRYVHLLSYA